MTEWRPPALALQLTEPVPVDVFVRLHQLYVRSTSKTISRAVMLRRMRPPATPPTASTASARSGGLLQAGFGQNLVLW